MTKHKKKLVVFLTAVVLGSGLLFIWPEHAGSVELEKPLSHSIKQFSVSDSNLAGGLKESGNAKIHKLFFRAMFMIFLVVVLGIAAIYISKKLLPKLSNLPGKKIRVIETTHFSSRKMIHLVKIGNKQLLIGSTNEKITMLADVSDAFDDLSQTEVNNV